MPSPSLRRLAATAAGATAGLALVAGAALGVAAPATAAPATAAAPSATAAAPKTAPKANPAANPAAAPTTNAPAAACSTGTAPVDEPYLCANLDQLVNVRIGDVRPTQPSLGYDEVYYKLGRYDAALSKDAVNKEFGDWCEANGQTDAVSAQPGATLRDPSTFSCVTPLGKETADSIAAMKTVVIGPGGALYLTDGHHTLTSFAETPDGGLNTHVRLRVLGNLSGLSTTDFWATMQANKWVWLQDINGKTITPSQLPKSVGLANFQDDRARSIMYFARDIGYTAGSLPFQEFYWGSWLRSHPEIADLATWNQDDLADSLAKVKAITQAQTALPQTSVVEAGFTAADLGVLTAWNDGKAEGKGEFSKLSAPYSSAKPGKLAYMIAYRATLPVATAPAAPAAPTASLSGHDVTVAWSAPADGGSALTGYTVTLADSTPGSAVTPLSKSVPASTTTATFTELAPGSYTATVTATNAVGTSSASAASAAVTVTPSDPEPTDPTTVKGSIVVTGDLTPGGTISVDGSGFAKSAAGFRVELHSDPILLGTVSTDAEGAFTLDATVPETIEAGAHTVVVLIDGVEVGGSAISLAAADPSDGANPTDDPSAPVVTSAADSDKDPGRLAFTGSQFVVPIVAAGGLLVLLGAAALVVAKRRKRV